MQQQSWPCTRQGAHPSSVARWLRHSGVFRMEWQRLCPGLGHKGAQGRSPQAENGQRGWSPASCPAPDPVSTSLGLCPAEAQPPARMETFPPQQWPVLGPHVPPGKVHPQRWAALPASPSPRSPFRASPEGRERPGSNPATREPAVPCSPLTGATRRPRHCPLGLFTPSRQSSSRSWCSTEVLTPTEVHPTCNVCEEPGLTGEVSTAADATYLVIISMQKRAKHGQLHARVSASVLGRSGAPG